MKKLSSFKWGYLCIMLITGAIGLCFLAFSNASLEALAIAMGATVTAAGIVLAVTTLASKERGFKFGIKTAFTVALLVCGITTMIVRTTAINIFIGLFGLLLIIDGTMKFHTTALAKRYRTPGWWLMLIISVILIGGGYITVRELTIEWSGTVYLLGGLFIVDAIANLLSAFYLGAAEKHNEEEIRAKIEEETAVKSEKASRRTFFKKRKKQVEEKQANSESSET